MTKNVEMQKMQMFEFERNPKKMKVEMFMFCVMTSEPIIIWTS